jgi:hypothetical protein
MGTTSLIVEIVIIGFQVLLWIFFIVASGWGYNWIKLSALKEWSAAVGVALIAVSYTLGLIFDSLVGALFAPWQYKTVKEERAFFSERGQGLPVSPAEMVAYIMATNKDAAEFLQRLFNQSRLLRATSANLLLIGISGFVFVVKRVAFSWSLLLGMLIGSASIAAMAIVTWIKTLRGYYYYLNESYRTQLKKDSKASGATD